MPDASLHIRVDGDIKVKAAQALSSIGMTTPEAVRSFLYRVATSPSFVHEMTIPNARVRAGMAETEEMIKAHRARFSTAKELFDDLEKNSCE